MQTFADFDVHIDRPAPLAVPILDFRRVPVTRPLTANTEHEANRAAADLSGTLTAIDRVADA
jgi:hypothetical protein